MADDFKLKLGWSVPPKSPSLENRFKVLMRLQAADTHKKGLGKFRIGVFDQKGLVDSRPLGDDRDFVRGDSQKGDHRLFHIVREANDVKRTPGSLGARPSIPEAEGETESGVEEHEVQIMDKHNLPAAGVYERSCAHAVELESVAGEPGKGELFPKVGTPAGGQVEWVKNSSGCAPQKELCIDGVRIGCHMHAAGPMFGQTQAKAKGATMSARGAILKEESSVDPQTMFH